jgi:hypothetical protein
LARLEIVYHLLMRALLSFVLTVSPLIAFAETAELSFIQPRTSVELSGWDRGRMRMYLASNSQACLLAQKRRSVHGDVALAFDVAGGHPRKIVARALDGSLKRFASCLSGILKDVSMPDAIPAYHWEGVLRFGVPRVLVMRVDWLESGMPERELDHVLLAALEKPAACMDEFFGPANQISATVKARFHVDAAGALSGLAVSESTVPPPGLIDCARGQLTAMAFPVGHAFGADVLLSFVKPIDNRDVDKDTPTVEGTAIH